MLSILSNSRSNNNNPLIKVTVISYPHSLFLTTPRLIFIGSMIAVIPRTKAMLIILDPRALPIPSFGQPSKAASPETTISGAQVPKPKMITPIISGEILKILAILAPLFVNASALQISNTKPDTRDIIDNNIFFLVIYTILLGLIIKAYNLE